ncbi:hypothetical protein [Streptomyces pinistramenti]|uniref:hypothetical protein n=1 Tax=Streptomyces pinistramenti TaxID=2884812 RepID=UPI001D083DCE|nr:hypothetical protein [Streptomyces pinistramenti]MCB5908808.1 hypothetical protein [Streptomyces pinistramenti]
MVGRLLLDADVDVSVDADADVAVHDGLPWRRQECTPCLNTYARFCLTLVKSGLGEGKSAE